MNQEQYPGLETLSYCIGFLEQFLAILSEPLLIACAALAVVDFVTGGKLLTLPSIMYVWAGSLAIAVSACFIVTWRRAIHALTLNRYGAAIGLCVLGIALGVVDWSAVDVQSLEQTLGVSFVSALMLLHLDIITLTHVRSAVAISMAVVVAVSNHTQVSTATAPKRRLVFMEKVLDTIAPVVEVTSDERPLQIEAPANVQRVYGGQFASYEQAIAAILARDPEATIEQIMGETGCKQKTAEKWKERLLQEQEKPS